MLVNALICVKKIATETNRYKMMLLTGSQKESTLNFIGGQVTIIMIKPPLTMG